MARPMLRFVAPLALIATLSGCALTTRHPSVAELKYNPGRYQNRTVADRWRRHQLVGPAAGAGQVLQGRRWHRRDDGAGARWHACQRKAHACASRAGSTISRRLAASRSDSISNRPGSISRDGVHSTSGAMRYLHAPDVDPRPASEGLRSGRDAHRHRGHVVVRRACRRGTRATAAKIASTICVAGRSRSLPTTSSSRVAVNSWPLRVHRFETPSVQNTNTSPAWRANVTSS